MKLAAPVRHGRTLEERRRLSAINFDVHRRRRRAKRNVMEYWIGLLHQSALMFAARTTLPHFSVSSAMSLPKSAGEPASAVPPRSASFAFSLGSARAAVISLLGLSTVSTGVAFGQPL